MTRKTGKMAMRARQQVRSAKLAKYKRELAEAGVKLSLQKPSAEARRESDEELKALYLEIISKKKEKPQEEGEQQEQAEQPSEQAEQQGEQQSGE